jgi:hypothetical protein
MGVIRGAIGKSNLMKDVGLPGLRQDTGLASDRTLPVSGDGYRDPEIDTGMTFDQALDSSRSRGYGRYEI